ncbi:MAG: hypothetical protein C7B46_20735 [Sulfobacillus benefaciens]|uniref:Uncharacterized protein n=1 Tax=Sulfobacillus benefaciens TaxID=453960 RepID=A0A2T2WSL8_9FIRM|nr:MAG: hypothetical protein C7B46_20735 [Sulfobacillus benefaciens]
MMRNAEDILVGVWMFFIFCIIAVQTVIGFRFSDKSQVAIVLKKYWWWRGLRYVAWPLTIVTWGGWVSLHL